MKTEINRNIEFANFNCTYCGERINRYDDVVIIQGNSLIVDLLHNECYQANIEKYQD